MTGQQQLARLQAALHDVDARATQLASSCPPRRWQQRAAGGGWAPSECVQHIVLSAEAMLARVDEAMAAGRTTAGEIVGPYRTGLLGRVLLWGLEPPYRRFRTRTGSAFVPAAPRPPEVDIPALLAAHGAVRDSLTRAQGLPLDRLHIASPFDARVRYNLYAAFSLLPVHARRHLWQAAQSIDSHADDAPGASGVP